MSFDPSWDEKDEFPDDNPAFTQQTSNMSGWGDDDDPSSPGGWDDLQDEDTMTQLEELIPKDIKQRVVDDISELKQITRFDVANANFGGGTRIILRAGIPVTHLGLDIEQARAWTLDPSKTIVMELSFPPHYFNILAHSEIKVHVGQAASVNGDLHGFRLSWTLMDKIKRFLATLPNTLTPRPYLLSDVHHVMETSSCSYEIAVNALLQTKGNRDSAVLHISNGLSRTSSTGKQQKQEEKSVMTRVKTPTKPTKEEQQLMTTFHVSQAAAKFALNLEPKVDDAALLLSDTTSRAEIEHMAAQADPTQSESERKSRLSPASAVTSLFNSFINRKQKSTSTSTYKDRIADKPLTSLFETFNYLVRVMLHLEAAIMTCNRSCMLCGQAVEFPGMKPTICGRDLCKMGQDDMGLGFSLEGEIISHPDLVDLFISLTVAAVQANKMHYVTPVGVRATVKGREELSFLAGDGKNLDYAKVMSTLNHVPSIADMKKSIEQGTLIETFNKKDPLIIPLLRWIMTSVRAHLRKLDPSEQMQSMKTPHQYVLLCTTPENEAQFQIEKRECERKKGPGNGSIYTFHGSSTGNWHSILRTGLKNMSNTKFMEHGASYGPGIYMAADSGTSLGYCRQQNGWDKSALGSSITCLALCEVVNDVKPPSPFYVVEKESLVATRYLFLYPSGGCPTMNAQVVGKEAPPLMTGQIGV